MLEINCPLEVFIPEQEDNIPVLICLKIVKGETVSYFETGVSSPLQTCPEDY